MYCGFSYTAVLGLPNILHPCTYAVVPAEGLRLERLNNDCMAEMIAKAPTDDRHRLNAAKFLGVSL